jgi:hypothetical protein
MNIRPADYILADKLWGSCGKVMYFLSGLAFAVIDRHRRNITSATPKKGDSNAAPLDSMMIP